MTTPTSAETLLLDTEPQMTNLYLSIYEPQMAAIVSISGSSYNRASQIITYNSLISGSASDITNFWFQVALVGTTPNSDDIGRTWVRVRDGTILRFVESDHIDWASANFITILKYSEIIPLFPRIIQNPSNDEEVIFYKIWDIPYTNQNSILGTYINMGSNYAGFLENGTGTCYWSASGTSNLLGNNLTYSWIFEGATITGSTAHTPGYVTWNQTGDYRVILRTTATSGRVDTSIRYVSFYDRPGKGNDTPMLNFELVDFGGHRDNIGYTCTIRVRNIIPRNRLRDGSLVVIFGDDYYGSAQQNINNHQMGRSNIKFVGYIAGGTIQYNYADGWVEFECISPTNFMELCECFSCSVESKASPSTWYQLLNMDLKRAIYHYLAWQSSVLLCCDVEFKNFTDSSIQFFDADRTSLYDAVNSLISSGRGGKLVSDALGKLWFEQEVSVIDQAAASLDQALSVTKKDWLDEPIIDERQHEEVSYIERGGIQYDTASGNSAALLSGAPGISPGYRGKADPQQGWAVNSQDELNEITGNLYAYTNSRYPTITLRMRANVNNVDIAPQEKLLLTIASSDTPRQITFTNKPFVIRGKTIEWDATTKRMISTLEVSEITQGFVGDTIIIPPEPPEEGGGDGGGEEPPPPPPGGGGDEPPPPVPSDVDAVVSTATDVRTSDNLDQASPSWSTKI